ncbi:hypothetical protein BC332_01109 [Capsicum chinense]|nr:hypothetical protein BC332_01109 [Capsicum chinense]
MWVGGVEGYWGNRYLQFIEDFHQTQPEDSQDLPLSQEQNERIWLDAVGGPGLSSFQDDESRETILALKQQIAELSSETKASQAREKKRDIQEKARPTNQEQISEIEVDMDKERTNDIDDFDKEHFINSDDEGSDESDDPHDMGSLMFSKSSLKRQL